MDLFFDKLEDFNGQISNEFIEKFIRKYNLVLLNLLHVL